MKLNEVVQDDSPTLSPLVEGTLDLITEAEWSAPMTADQLLATLGLKPEGEVNGQES